ncbi:NAD(P)H-dependent oxidoreductase subunit E [Siculibacillus lacustris]|nr:NAD(P)H-dependent oxidoreductase subunit E [Siculibacillus lacustris]
MPSGPTDDGALPLLRARAGHRAAETAALLEARFGVSAFEARALIAFAATFRPAPGEAHVIGVCRGESCARRGGRTLGDRLAARLGIAWYGRTGDGRLRLEPAYCLGLCASGPSAMIDGELAPRLDVLGVEALLAELGLDATATGPAPPAASALDDDGGRV